MSRRRVNKARGVKRRWGRIILAAVVLLAYIIVGVVLGLVEKGHANIRLAINDYRSVAVCVRVVSSSVGVWPQAAVVASTRHGFIDGPSSVVVAVQPSTDVKLLEAGLKEGVVLDRIELETGSPLAVGVALSQGDAALINLVPPAQAIKETVPSLAVTWPMKSEEDSTLCAPDEPFETYPTQEVLSFFDSSVSAFGRDGVVARFIATGRDANRLDEVIGGELGVSPIASTLDSLTSVPGLLPAEMQPPGAPFTLSITVTGSDGQPNARFSTAPDDLPDLDVGTAAEAEWVVRGVTSGDLRVDGESIDVGEGDLVEFRSTPQPLTRRVLVTGTAGDVTISAQVTDLSVNGESRMPRQLPFLSHWQWQVLVVLALLIPGWLAKWAWAPASG